MQPALRTAAIITLLTLVAAAGPTAASDWFGMTVSNHGVSLGFGSSGWGLWGSSWSSGNWNLSFDAALAGYGEWISVSGLGRVWRPWVAADWRPYRYGRWVWTAAGWTWVAYEPWGWMPHHYGSWAMTSFGWVWSPGYTYHPGSVVWVRSGGYVGWYPCAPRGWSHSWRGGHAAWHDGYRNGYTDGWRDARYATWVPWSKMGSDNLADVTVSYTVATRGVARTAVVATAAAPSRLEVERHIGRPVPAARVVERSATIDGRQVKVVRPDDQAAQVRRYGNSTVERALASRAVGKAPPNSPARSRSGAVQSDVRHGRTTISRSPSAPRTTAQIRSSSPGNRSVQAPRESTASAKTRLSNAGSTPRQQGRPEITSTRPSTRSSTAARERATRPPEQTATGQRSSTQRTGVAPTRSPAQRADRPAQANRSRSSSSSAASSKSRSRQREASTERPGTSRRRGPS